MKPPQSNPNNVPDDLADDLLIGADAIGEFILGSGRNNRRKIYYLVESSRLPVFRLGAMLCARKSVVLRWIAGQETRSLGLRESNVIV